MSPPFLAVLGATGHQGGSLAQAALADPHRRFAVRALTRRSQCVAADALARAGAQVMHADLDDGSSLARAFAGVDAVFAMTNFWEHGSAERELAQAAHIAAAARSAGVKHLVWSTLEDTREFMAPNDLRMPTLQGRFKVPHLDAKGEANRLFLESGVPTTFLYLSFYWDNLIHFGMGPKREADGTLAFSLPIGDAALPGIAAQDIGACALALFAQGAAVIGQHVGIAGEHLTLAQMAHSLGRALGEPVQARAMAPADYARMAFAGADELANMFQFKRDFSDAFRARRPVVETRCLNPAALNFDAWLLRHAHALATPPRAAAHGGH
jgi:uncharacterized protein YbjT (DUF2867 family)